ncbi:hypothetical protein [Nonomuraea roseola]|uniref:Peptidase MA-like domain-containing protein n=1 Tax=Nonomuraea roseola TaxID=46179 RepID=A0ABV5PSN4_9ACTN
MAFRREDEPPPWLSSADEHGLAGPAERRWIDSSMAWFVRQFGKDIVLRDVALPTPEFFHFLSVRPGGEEALNALVSKARRLMAVEASDIRVRLFTAKEHASEGTTVGHYDTEDGHHVIGIDRRQLADRTVLTAVVAHELCHVRLLGEGRVSWEREDQERLTDLLTVYLGFGVFTANAAMRFARAARGWQIMPRGYLSDELLNGASSDLSSRRLGYLTQQEFGYALARYCWLRGETRPSWAAYLGPGARAALTRGLAHLAHDADDQEFRKPATEIPLNNRWFLPYK